MSRRTEATIRRIPQPSQSIERFEMRVSLLTFDVESYDKLINSLTPAAAEKVSQWIVERAVTLDASHAITDAVTQSVHRRDDLIAFTWGKITSEIGHGLSEMLLGVVRRAGGGSLSKAGVTDE